MNITRPAAAATAALLVATAWGSNVGSTTSPETGEVVTLRIGTDDGPGAPSVDQIDEFARHVDTLSGGSLAIDGSFRSLGAPNIADWDQQVAQLMLDGELEMAMIPARSWDRLGVDSFLALHAPFLVDSHELLDAVVADPIAEEMLAGLEAIGVTGLALVPEGLRRVFSFGEPMRSTDDFDGALIRTPSSSTTFALFEALGANPDDLGGPPEDRFRNGVADGSVAAAESSFAFAGGLPAPTAVVGNVTLFPKANVIAIATDVFESLHAEHQEILRTAALAARDWAIGDNPHDAELAERYCEVGGTIVHADDAELRALHDATDSVYEQLTADPQTAGMIERIRELAAEVGPTDSVAPCTPDAPPPSIMEPITIDGVYQFDVTYDELLAAGIDDRMAQDESGVYTITLDGGDFVYEFPDGMEVCGGSYEIDGDRVTFRWSFGCHGDWAMTASVEGDEIVWTYIVSLPPHTDPELQLINQAFNSVPWTRVGDVDDPADADGSFPSGVYRIEIAADELLTAGVDQMSAVGHAGTWTLTFADGQLTVHDVNASTGEINEGVGVYCVDGDQIGLGLVGDPPQCGDFWCSRWALDGDELRFSDVSSGHGFDLLIETLFGSRPFTRIG